MPKTDTIDEIGMTDDEWRRHHHLRRGQSIDRAVSTMAENAITATTRAIRRRNLPPL